MIWEFSCSSFLSFNESVRSFFTFGTDVAVWEDLISSHKPLPATDLIAFLSYYAKFDFKNNAISTNTRTGLIKRSAKGWTIDPEFISIQHPVDRCKSRPFSLFSKLMISISARYCFDSLSITVHHRPLPISRRLPPPLLDRPFSR